MLVKDKVSQAGEILREFNIDCWIAFVRESQVNGDSIPGSYTGLTYYMAFCVRYQIVGD